MTCSTIISESKMSHKIVVFARSIPFHNSGGLEVVTWDLCKGLALNGNYVELVTTKIPETKKIEKIDNLEIIQLPDTLPGRYSSEWWKYSEEYMKEGDDISAVISVSAAGYGSLKNKKKFPNTVFIMQAHGTALDELKTKIRSGSVIKACKGIKNIYWTIKDLFFYKKFDYVVGIGDAVIESLKKKPYSYNLNKECLVKIENGIDDFVFRFDYKIRQDIRDSLDIREDEKLMISVSRLHPEKGVENNLNVVRKILDDNKNFKLKYIVCGGGRELEGLKRKANELNIGQHVIFVGDKKRQQISELLSAADLFVFLTERIEGLPLNVLEAQSSGIPMVISDHLTFSDSDFCKKVKSDDIALAAELISDLFKRSEGIKRVSYINKRNTLTNSTAKYQELLTRD